MASNGESKKVPGFGRMGFIDGHGLNHSYKNPSAHPSGRENLSYQHPHGSQHNFEEPWQAVDKLLNESARHPEQLSASKTVFPVDTGKVRGAPKPNVLRTAKQAPAIIK
jgi:hypothetical protein